MFLVPIGGGKDSATSLEILKRTNKKIIGFSVGDHKSINNTAKAADISMVNVKRQIDPELLRWNTDGAFNGHVPVTALVSTLACVAGYCIGAQSVVMSNESSANEATRIVEDVEVNHQFSKSFIAEKYLRDAIASFVNKPINYFSILRILSEYEIFSIFSMAKQFHNCFTSCNRVFKINKNDRTLSWCGECDKCRFVFIGMSAFLEIEYVSKIFGKNLLDEKNNTQGFLDLIGMGNGKPFECVGTIGETVLLMKKALNKINKKSKLKTVLSSIKDIDFLSKNHKLNKGFGVNNFVEKEFIDIIENLKFEEYTSEVLARLDGERIGIVGLGRDTAGIIRYLENIGYKDGISIFLPDDQNISDIDFVSANEELKINDVGFARKCVRNQSDLDSCTIIFVSPGISKYSKFIKSLKKRATTPLAWWLATNKSIFPEKIFIGITGTKGKSTTSSMLKHILKDSILLGNIGSSVGSLPLNQLMDSRYIILEVSSFQASYITISPHVGVLTSLFDCHIDWHITPERYYKDKKNLFEHGCDVVYTSDEDLDITLSEQNENMIFKIMKTIKPEMLKADIQAELKTFPGLQYRKEVIAIINGVIYISDVLATAPHSSVEALKDIAKTYKDAKIFLLYGGANRNVSQSDAIDEFNKIKSKYVVITLPDTGFEVESQLKNVKHCEDLACGIIWASENAKPGDVVLLAPGAPSFHRYENYEKLHEHFIELVDNI